MNPVRITILLSILLLSGALSVHADTQTYIATLNTTGTLNVPSPDISDGVRACTTSSDVLFSSAHLQVFSVDQTGSYVINVDSTTVTDNDTALYLYTSYNPADIQDGCLFYNDDRSFVDFSSTMTVTLEANTSYTIIVTPNGVGSGIVDVSISGPGTVCIGDELCTVELAGGRINDSPARDIAPPVAIYLNGNTLTVWAINPKTAKGVSVLSVSRGSTNPPAQNEIIAVGSNPFTGYVIQIWRLSTGEYQLHTSEGTGRNTKAYIIGWNRNGSGLYHIDPFTGQLAPDV